MAHISIPNAGAMYEEEMSNKAILEKAIQKAIDGGWQQPWVYYHGNTKDKKDKFKKWLHNLDIDGYSDHEFYNYDDFICIPGLIFNNDFAKALWGEERIPVYGNSSPFNDEVTSREVAWQYHLQQMVIADDPIKYLGENI